MSPFVDDGKSVAEAKEGITLPEEYAGYGFPWHLPADIEKVCEKLTVMR